MSAARSSRSPRRAVPTVEVPVERFDLECGAKLLVSQRRGAPVTAVQVHFRGGVSLDPPGLEGRAYLAGSLADQGTKAHTEAALAEALESLGAHLGGNANGLSGSVVSKSWKPFLTLCCEVLTTPTFPRKLVERQVQRLTDRLRIEERDPRQQASLRFRELVYGGHWLGRPAYGSRSSLARIERTDLTRHVRESWVAARAVIAVCGDVRPNAVRKALDELLRGWKTGAQLPPQALELPERAVRCSAFEIDREQVHVLLGHLGVRRADPDYPALVVMDHVLGTGPGFTNRIAKRLRDELGLAYSVNASIHTTAGILPGIFQAYIGTSRKHVETAIDGFLAEIRRIRDEPVDELELAVARDYLVGSFVLGFQRASRRAAWLVSAERHGFPDDTLERLPREFAAVTPADVQRVARAHLFPDACAVATGGPLAQGELEALVARTAPVRRGAHRTVRAARAR